MAQYKLVSKLFTLYDETDNLKRMKDSDILAEKKKPTSNPGETARNMVTGASLGGVVGAGLGLAAGISQARKLGARANMGKTLLQSSKRGGLAGLAVGAVGAGLYTHLKNKNKYDQNRAYNQRLAYAQRQAARRERKDWKTNMTQRDGYSY